MNLDQLNQELSKLCSIPESERTQAQLETIHQLEQLIDAKTMEGNHE